MSIPAASGTFRAVVNPYDVLALARTAH